MRRCNFKEPDWFEGYEFLEVTPGGGDAYYDSDGDRAIIVYHNKIKVYSNRKKHMYSKHACSFSDCNVIECKQKVS